MNLLPVLLRLTQRSEPALHDTLASAIEKMAPVLGVFFTDGETKVRRAGVGAGDVMER